MQIRKSMLIIVLLTIFGFSAVCGDQAIMSSGLQQKLQGSSTEELIPINIIMKAQYDCQDLMKKSSGLSKTYKRSYVIRELKTFTEYHQADILRDLENLSYNDAVKDIAPLWASNVISCKATSEVIYDLIQRSDIDCIDYDEIQKIFIYETEDTDRGTKDIAWNISQIDADDVWDLGYTGDGVIIAMIDTGVNYNHVDLADHLWTDLDYPNHGWDFFYNDDDPMDEFGHGTHCAGIVAGDGTAGTHTGMAPDAQIMCLKTADDEGNTGESILWNAVQFAVEHGADIISASWGFAHATGVDRGVWRNLMDTVLAADMIVFVAAGNLGQYPYSQYPIPDNVVTPGDCPPPWLHPDQTLVGGISSVVCVGATDSDDVIANFSSVGPVTWEDISGFSDYAYDPEMGLIRPDVVAPGVNITSLDYTGTTGYVDMSGTSMAAPCVAGVMALMLSKNPDLTPGEIDGILEENAYPLTATKSNDYGSGRIDALAAINHVCNHGALTGIVTDPSSGDPIENAQITAAGYTIYTVSTNNNGEYMIEDIPSGSYVIECSATGYNTVIEPGIMVNPDETTTLSFSMDAPVMNVTSGSVTAEVAPHSPVRAEVTIENLGTGDLIWNASVIDTNRMVVLSPECDTVAVGQSSVLAVNFTVGDYAYGDVLTCSIVIESDPDVGTITLPVTATVIEPAYGGLTGTVISTNEGTPISDALVTVSSYVDTTYYLTTNSIGEYTLDDFIVGSYFVECSANTYNTTIEPNVAIVADETTTCNFSLNAPIVNITPTAITKEVRPDSVLEIEVRIANVGSGDLSWYASIDGRSTLPVSIPPASDDFPRGTDELSFGKAPLDHSPGYSYAKADFALPRGSVGYGYDLYDLSGISIDTGSPDVLNTIFSDPYFISLAGSFGTESAENMYYCNSYSWELVYIDIETGAYNTIGQVGTSIEDMSCDMTTGIMYGISDNAIYTIDLTNGSSDKIGDIGCEAMVAIAVDGNGDMWGHDISLDEIWSINKETGIGTSVGSTGFDANYAQSMAWDPVTRNIYLAAFNNSNDSYELRVADTTTGATELLGGIEDRQVTVLSFPSLGSWITLDTMNGVIPAGGSSTFHVTLKTLGHEYGEILTCDIVIETDPDIGTITIPVTVEVGEISAGEEPTEYETKLLGNFPNPMRNSTTISFSIKERSHVRLSVYNIRGQLVETLLNEEIGPAASYNVVWNGTSRGRKLANGIYLYKLEADKQSFLKKMILMK